MPKASVKRIIDKKKDKLIEFVLDIEKYPEFIPFCLGSKVYDRKEENNQILIIADLTIGKGPFSDTYKSDVCNVGLHTDWGNPFDCVCRVFARGFGKPRRRLWCGTAGHGG